MDTNTLPEPFLKALRELQRAYLAASDPMRQSGFGGGPERWRAEREPILQAVEHDGDLLDVGCANGLLLESLRGWAQERGIALIPYGLDQGEQLIAMARARLPAFASHFFCGNGWTWQPPRRFRYVYTLYDCVPHAYLAAYIGRLLDLAVAPQGRLIVGAYGSRSRQLPPFPIAKYLATHGFAVAGSTAGGRPPITVFAWIERI
jgi:hypothetical protein